MRITTKSSGVEIAWDTDDSDETKEFVHHLIELMRIIVMLLQK